MKRGIITAADQNQEWLLPWWLKQVKKHTHLPITIFDLGMTTAARKWCKKNAFLLSITPRKNGPEKPAQISTDLQKLWTSSYTGNVWEAREAWFKKPQICQATPYEESLWLDLDCEILSPLDPLFNHLNRHTFAVAAERTSSPEPLIRGKILYNSGVILYRKNSPIIKEWVYLSSQLSRELMGDQSVLTYLLHQGKHPFQTLLSKYNWHHSFGHRKDIAIFHWVGQHGKREILAKIMAEKFVFI